MAYRIVYPDGKKQKKPVSRAAVRLGALLLGITLGLMLEPQLGKQRRALRDRLDPPGKIRAMEQLAASLQQGESLGNAIGVFWEELQLEKFSP